MIGKIVLIALALVAAGSLMVYKFRDPLVPVSQLNLPAYLGTWIQVASSPLPMQTFQKDGFCIEPTYGVNTNGTVSVFNQMNVGSPYGPLNNITGYAYVPNSNKPGELKVHFPVNPIDADYWIIELGPIINNQYQWAVVSEPTKLFMWVLVRNTTAWYSTYEATVKPLVVNTLGFNHVWNRYVESPTQGCTL